MLETKCESLIHKYGYYEDGVICLVPSLLPDLIEELIITIQNSTEHNVPNSDD